MSSIPEHTLAAIDAYVTDRVPPGGFLRAVLTNNLTGAALCADSQNYKALADIAMYCHGNIPARCWGSPEKVNAWLNERVEEEKVT